MLKSRYLALSGFIFFAALMRIVPHPWNFSPVAAMALFGGAQFRDKASAFLFPLSALFLSDLVLGFYPGIGVVYASFALIVLIGMAIRKNKTVLSVSAAALASSLSFFLITNFSSWMENPSYPRTIQGLTSCYIAGLPFFQNTLIGDIFYSAVLFGGFALAEKWYPALQDVPGAPLSAVA